MRRTFLATLAVSWLTVTACVGLGLARDAEAAVFGPTTVVSVSVFYDNLAPYGRWVDTAPYGWAWMPDMAPAGWRPYSDGYWVYTDFGWAWVSGEPWGWATYHYGRWFEDPAYGWMWVPGTEWGPAWVAWRESDDWVGWAPLPPTATWSAWSGLRFESVSVPTASWCFVQRRGLTEPALRLASESRNVTLLSRTRDATRFRLRSGRPVDEGVSLAAFERQTGRRVPRLRIVDALSPQRRPAASGSAVAFYRPHVQSQPGAMPPSRVIERGRNRPETPARNAEFPRVRTENPARFQPRGNQEQRQSMESMRSQRQAQQQAFEQRQAEQRARMRDIMRRQAPAQGPPPSRAQRGDEGRQQPPPRAQRGDEGRQQAPSSAQRGDQPQPSPGAERGRDQSQQSADRHDQGRGHGKKNGHGG